jgi:hypothetical protein
VGAAELQRGALAQELALGACFAACVWTRYTLMYLTVAPAILFSIQLCRSRRNADPRRSFWRVALTHRLAWIALAAIAALVASNLEIFGNWTGTDAVRAQHARFEAIPAFSMASLESLFWLARTLLFSETTWFGDRIQPWTGAWTTHLAITGFAIGWLAAVSLRTPNAAGDRAESSVLWLSMISVGALAAEFALITNLGGINFDHGRFLYPMLPVFLALAMEGFFRLGGRAPGKWNSWVAATASSAWIVVGVGQLASVERLMRAV